MIIIHKRNKGVFSFNCILLWTQQDKQQHQ